MVWFKREAEHDMATGDVHVQNMQQIAHLQQNIIAGCTICRYIGQQWASDLANLAMCIEQASPDYVPHVQGIRELTRRNGSQLQHCAKGQHLSLCLDPAFSSARQMQTDHK